MCLLSFAEAFVMWHSKVTTLLRRLVKNANHEKDKHFNFQH